MVMYKKGVIVFLAVLLISSFVSFIPLSSAEDYDLSVSVSGSGGANPHFTLEWQNGTVIGEYNSFSGSFANGSLLEVHPYPAVNYLFSHFTINGEYTEEHPLEFELTEDTTVLIFFDYYPPPTNPPSSSPTPTPTPYPYGSSGAVDSGYWDISGEYPHYADYGLNRQSGFGLDVINYNHIDLQNNQGLEANFTINRLYGERYNWYDIAGVKRFWVAIDLFDGVTHAFNKFYIAHEQGVFFQTMEMRVGSEEIVPYFTPFSGSSEMTNITDLDFSLQLGKISDTVCAVYLMDIHGTILRSGSGGLNYDNAVWNETFEVEPSFWDNANFTVYVAHEGCGYVDVTFTGLEINNLDYYQFVDYGQYDTENDWLSQAWAVLVGIYEVVKSLFSLASGLFVVIAPITPFVFLFWLFDAVLTSIYHMSFKPLGTVIQKIWDFVLKVYQLAINSVSAIGDLLPF